MNEQRKSGIRPDLLPVIFKVVSDAEMMLLQITGFKIDLEMKVQDQQFLTGEEAVKDMLQRLVCEQFHISWSQIVGPLRNRNIVEGRHAYMFISNRFLGLTKSAIGKDINRDHTSVIHGIKTIDGFIKIKDVISHKIEAIKQKLYEHQS